MEYRGRTEVFHEGSWGALRDYPMSAGDYGRTAQHICALLALRPRPESPCGLDHCGAALLNVSVPDGFFWLEGVNCSGTEQSIVDCESVHRYKEEVSRCL